MLFLIYLFSVFIIIVPMNLLNTLQSPSFINYLGIPDGDILIRSPAHEDLSRVESLLQSDKDVDRYSTFLTHSLAIENSEGRFKKYNVDTGDFEIFFLPYLTGSPPRGEQEIALSYLTAQDLEKKTGDTLRIKQNSEIRELRVSGIYQDLTNGGRTTKVGFSLTSSEAQVFSIIVAVKEGGVVSEVEKRYADRFPLARVFEFEKYKNQTLGSLLEQMKLINRTALVIGLFVSLLFTFLFLKIAMTRERGAIAIMRGLGFSLKDIRSQYLFRLIGILILGIVVGTIAANTLGEAVMGIFFSFLGASKITFEINPISAFILVPILLIGTTMLSLFTGLKRIQETSIAMLNTE